MRINTNINSLIAQESSNINNQNSSSSLEKLSSGFAINKASDNASGLAISDKLRTQRSSLDSSVNNANSAIAMMQIADRAMGEQSNILDIVKTKLIQSATATTSSEGSNAIAKDINKLLNQLDNIAKQTNYNGQTILQESSTSQNVASTMTFQVGEKNTDTIVTDSNIQANTNGLAASAPLDDLSDLKTDTSGSGTLLNATNSKTYLSVIDLALDDLNNMRSSYGSTQVQVESSLRNINTAITNISSAESVIRDVDFAQESANFSKNSIVSTASSYTLSQANSVQNDVLKLLQ
ncbi:MAG: flagellin [Campylobacterota bacterium]|nr:flagellin [Campylobacterota bacterium]